MRLTSKSAPGKLFLLKDDSNFVVNIVRDVRDLEIETIAYQCCCCCCDELCEV